MKQIKKLRAFKYLAFIVLLYSFDMPVNSGTPIEIVYFNGKTYASIGTTYNTGDEFTCGCTDITKYCLPTNNIMKGSGIIKVGMSQIESGGIIFQEVDEFIGTRPIRK